MLFVLLLLVLLLYLLLHLQHKLLKIHGRGGEIACLPAHWMVLLLLLLALLMW